MSVPFNPPAPLDEVPLELKQSVRDRVERKLCILVKKLSGTVFYNESCSLESLRGCIGSPGIGSSLDLPPQDILHHFYASVPFTKYDDYSPYVSRLFKADPQPCCVSDIRDLLAPGLPSYVAHSSGTSGAGAKHFFKYPSTVYKPVNWESEEAGARMGNITICQLACISLTQIVSVAGDSEDTVHVPISQTSGGGMRAYLGIGALDDAYLIDKKAPFFTSPFAAWLLPSYTSSAYMNAFFAILDGTVVFMTATFSTLLYDAVRLIEDHWDTWIEAIERGQLPEVAELGMYRPYLQAHLKSNPERARKLRLVEKGEEGWLKKIWPNLAIVRVTLSGPYAMLLPKLRYHFGPTVNLQSVVYASTESMIGYGYDAKDTNLYRLDSEEHIELLDVEKKRTIENLSQPWEVVSGKKYEIVVTNNDGLWRYMLNDVVEVAGFSPTDGQPLIRYVGRKEVAFRLAAEFVTQSFLQQAITSLSGILGDISEFTVEIDERKLPRAYGFIVELQGELGPNAHLALKQLNQYMLLDEGYKKSVEAGYIRDPTIRIVPAGTFQAYRNWQIEKSGFNPSQVKIPVAIVDLEVSQWLAERVSVDLELEYGAK